MSDGKKRDRALQRRVRERQEKTGESYQAAYQQIVEPAKDGFAAFLEGRIGPPAADTSRIAARLMLPLSTAPRVLPGSSVQITSRAQLLSFWPERLFIKNAEHWTVERITVGLGKSPWSTLIEDDHRHASTFSLETWQPLIQRELLVGEPVAMTVTYAGPNEEGECFEAVLFGWDNPPPARKPERSTTDAAPRVSERAESKDVRRDEMAILPISITSPTLFVDRFTIADAADWIVHDIRTHGKTIFASGGDLPGEMFSGSAPVILRPLAAKDRVEIAATYVGNKPTARLSVELSGTQEPPRTIRDESYFLPLSTDVAIMPTQSAQITGSSGRVFQPDRLVIADPDHWLINDIRIGNRCQTAQAGDFPAQVFSIRAVGCEVTFDRVPRASDFVIVTTREDGCEEAPFYAGVQGRLV
jgi:hypothetical protein